jgi:hypothetical protein
MIQVVKDQHLFSDCGLQLCCRYIYLWIKYALFEEIDAGDMDRAREVYRAALKLVPHHQFTFSKVGVGTHEGSLSGQRSGGCVCKSSTC